jgi:hypothetical protein
LNSPFLTHQFIGVTPGPFGIPPIVLVVVVVTTATVVETEVDVVIVVMVTTAVLNTTDTDTDVLVAASVVITTDVLVAASVVITTDVSVVMTTDVLVTTGGADVEVVIAGAVVVVTGAALVGLDDVVSAGGEDSVTVGTGAVVVGTVSVGVAVVVAVSVGATSAVVVVAGAVVVGAALVEEEAAPSPPPLIISSKSAALMPILNAASSVVVHATLTPAVFSSGKAKHFSGFAHWTTSTYFPLTHMEKLPLMQALASFGFVSSHVESAVSRANALFASKASCLLLVVVAASERAVPDGLGDEVFEDAVWYLVEVETDDEVDDGALLEDEETSSLLGATTGLKDSVEVAAPLVVVVRPDVASVVEVGLDSLLEVVAVKVGLDISPSPEDNDSLSVTTGSKDLVEVAESPSVVVGPGVPSMVEVGLSSLLEDVAIEVGLAVGPWLEDDDSVSVMTESKDLVEVAESTSVVGVASMVEIGLDSLLEDVAVEVGLSLEDDDSVSVTTESNDLVEVTSSPSFVVVSASLDAEDEAEEEVILADVVKDEGSTNIVVVTTGPCSVLVVGSTKRVLVVTTGNSELEVEVDSTCAFELEEVAGFPSMNSKLRVLARGPTDIVPSLAIRARLRGMLASDNVRMLGAYYPTGAGAASTLKTALSATTTEVVKLGRCMVVGGWMRWGKDLKENYLWL